MVITIYGNVVLFVYFFALFSTKKTGNHSSLLYKSYFIFNDLRLRLYDSLKSQIHLIRQERLQS